MGRSFRASRVALLSTMMVGAAALFSQPAMSASQGSKGGTSQGSVGVDAQVAQLVQLSNLDDIDFGSFDGNEATDTDDVCVWTNTGGYAVKASSANGSGSFLMSDGASANLTYEVSWADSPGAATGTDLSENAQATGFGGTFSGPTCGGGGSNATLILTLLGSAANATAPAGAYSDTLTIEVAPQ